MPYSIVANHEYKSTLPKCVIRVDDGWYDCTAWRGSHPGGAELVDKFHQQDATDAFYAIHSDEAVAMLKKMRAKPLSSSDAQRDPVSIAFEAFRKDLEAKGWMKRNWWIDFSYSVLPVVVLAVLGTLLSYSYPVIATLMIAMSMQQAGWIGHDYSHGRGQLSYFLGTALGGLINGFSSEWWKNKHDTHHVFPNRKEHDADIHNEPILYLWVSDEVDGWHRRYQHYYYMIVYSFLYASWRMQSIQYVMGSKNWFERSMIAMNYIWIACLPWKVAVGSILLGGLFVAVVVTANHQTEEMIEPDDKYNFVIDQFRTTRGVYCKNLFSEYFFGGMQYQLEHHLFPIMPRYRYPALRELVRKFAQENNLQYHMNSVFEIFVLNFQQMKKIADTEPIKKSQ
ncbi:delta-8 fatty acid desaturase-like protein, putative [Bodo saltans]|uniref:Delta-8 fatty acid desaturase-like protein, putative n=1 Tax=Bodo saltans TaxID=75058 RepID=A0A0S4KLP1_BODSA|nr:delta-8 fatty acid desaturase-like protein, putative [Bodo saltans]|eukprot:CUI15334.1 delta-8 fatty acid desaturase-like protein, putative [Bodo saltans]